MNGLDFLAEVRKDSKLKSLTVFVMTTSNEETGKLTAHNLNVAGYIIKLFSFKKFVPIISTLKKYWTLCE